jgi:Uma2 family endonuclease
MDPTLVEPPARLMTREEYRRWVEAQPRGHFERVEGRVVAMAPERSEHAEIKGGVYRALWRAVSAAGLPDFVYPDGMTVEVGPDDDYEPDCVVNGGGRAPPGSVEVDNPIVVVEVISPSSKTTDTGAKLAGYFRVPSVRHYLIFRADRPEVIHHRRRDDGGIETRVLDAGRVRLDPPGIEFEVEEVYAA